MITSPSVMNGVVDQPVSYAVTATNSPTGYFAWLPRDFAPNPTTGVVSGRARYPYQTMSGDHYLYATNASGTVARTVTLNFSVPSAPWIADVAANNEEPLIVGEAWVGSVTAYDSSGHPITSGLTFSADGLPPGLAVSGGMVSGTPTTAGSFPVVLHVSASMGAASRATTLNVAPAYAAIPSRITRVTLPANGVYVASLGCSFQIHFSRPVTITGSPRLAVTVGTTTRYATWGGPPLSGGPFTYTQIPLGVRFEPEDFDPDGITIAGALDLNGGSIKDADGNNVDVSFAPGDTRGILVAPIPPPVPRIVAVNQTATGFEITGTGSGDVVVSRSSVGVLGSVAVGGSGNWSFYYTPPSVTNGDYTFTARGKLRTALIYSEDSVPFTKTINAAADTTPPTISYFVVGASSVDSRTVTFSLGFNEPVTGVTRDSFAVSTSSGTTASIASVGPNGVSNGTTYLVTVSYSGPAGGTITCNVRSSGSGIADLTGNAYAGGGSAGSDTFIILPDTTPPRLSTFVLTANDSAAGVAEMTANFSEPVTGVDASDFAIDTTPNATASILGVTPAAGTVASAWVVRFSYAGTSGSVQMAIKTSGTGIADQAGNPFQGAGTSATPPYPVNNAPPADMTLPGVTEFRLGAVSLPRVTYHIGFNEPVTGLNPAGFVVLTTGSATAKVDSVTGSGTLYAINLSVGGSGTVQLLALGGATANIRDGAAHWWNGYASNPPDPKGGTDTLSPVYTIGASGADVTPPQIASFTVSANTANSVTFAARFNEEVEGATTSSFAVNASAGTTASIASVSPNAGSTTTYDIVLNYSGAAGGTVSVSARSSGSGIMDLARNAYAGGGTATSATFTIPAAGSPPATTPPVGNPPPTTTPPPAGSTKVAQSITFNSPVSAIVIGQPITLGALSSAGLPIAYSIVSGDAAIEGNVLTPRSTAALIVRASSAGSDSVEAASSDVNFGHPQKAAQAITLAGMSDTTTGGGPFTLPATTSAGLPIMFAVSGPARIEGNMLVLTGAPGTVTLRANSAGNDTYTAAAEVVRTFAVRALGQQIYLGNMGGDAFAFALAADNSRGVFVTRLASTGEAIVAKFRLNADGSFSAAATSSAGVARTLSGNLANGVIAAGMAELGANFTATVQPPNGVTASLAGLYTANFPGSASGEAYVVVAPAGQAFVVAVTPFGVTSGTGTVSSAGEFTVATADGGAITGTVNPTDGTVRGALNNGNNTAALAGLSEAVVRTDRLVNLSSRLRTSSDASHAMIAGFVVTGTEAKPMLIRAIGPSLSAFGVQGALANPRLQIYNNTGALVAENEDWASNAVVAAAAERVGAFKLDGTSRDAAVLATLAPGAYTAQVATNGGTGVALIEVYDASDGSTGSGAPAPQVINISTRGFVDSGEGNLIAGFVVSGNAPKRVLIRGIGPSLASFGVQDAVANPTLKLYAAGSAAVIAQNDDWSTAQPINGSQAAATAADIAAAANAAGAFPLVGNSRDAAIVITLAPGAYAAVVGDAANGAGAGLIEVYQLDSP